MKRKLLIIPTYNEVENISDIVSSVMTLKEDFHVLVVDDSSPDGTGEVVKSLQPQYPGLLFLLERKSKDGLGRAYVSAFKWALERDYDYIFQMDADFSHNPQDLPRMYSAGLEADMVIGSRYCQGVNVVNWPIGRVLLSYFASRYIRFVLGIPVHDATAGFACFSRKLLQGIDLEKVQLIGYGFQIEMKYRAYKKKFIIKEIPIIFTDRKKGASKMSQGIIKEAIFGVLDLKLKSWFGNL